MELEELKNIWSQYDKKLNDSLHFNEEVVRKMNLEKAKNNIQKPYQYEMFNLIVVFFTCIFSVGFSIRMLPDMLFSLVGFAGSLLAGIFLTMAVIKINRFTRIDYYNSNIVCLQKDLSLLKTTILRMRKLEFILIPFLVGAILPLAFKAIHNYNVFSNIWLYILEMGFILGVSYPVGFWIYRHVYDKKIKDAEMFLKEIEEFEKES